MINPNSFTGINPLQNQGFVPQLGGANLANGAGSNPLAPVGDSSGLSPEASGGEGDMAQMMQALMQAFGMGQQQEQTPEQRIAQLQQEIAVTEQQLSQAQQAGDEQSVQGLSQKLETLKAELAQLTGQQGGGAEQGGGAPAGGGADGGGAPPSGGGAEGGGAPPSGGGGAPDGGGAPPSGGGAAPNGGGSSPDGGGTAPVDGNGQAPPSGNTQDIAPVPPELAGDDKKMAEFIEGKLAGTPLAGKGLGAHFVEAGKQNNVDPMILASISKHETNHGKLGVGPVKHMGVGAFDASPNQARKWDGEVNQIYSGAKTFSNLRKKHGSSPDAPIADQLRAVNGNGKGWATDKSWHTKVGNTYNNYASSARSSTSSNVASTTPKASTPAASSSTTKKA